MCCRLRASLSALSLCLMVAGCEAVDLSASESSKELDRLARAVDRVVQAPNSDKASALLQLRDLPCRHWCDISSTCLSGFRLHVEARARVHRAKLSSRGQRPADRAEVLDTLDRARVELGQALSMIKSCQRQLEDARRRTR